MTTSDREILEAVASGRMTPGEAAQRLERERLEGERLESEPLEGADARPRPEAHMGPDEGRDAARDDDRAPGQPSDGPRPGFRVRISATARSVRVVGDPTVTEAAVEGPHRAHRDGDTLFIDGNIELDDVDGFTFEGLRPLWHRRWAGWRRLAEQLVVRVNPGAPVDAEVSAGSLVVVGVTGPLHIVLAAGSARLDGTASPFDIETRAGAVRVRGRLDTGDSRIRCEAGSVNVHLSRGSDVRVRARTDLGRVRVHGIPGGYGPGSGSHGPDSHGPGSGSHGPFGGDLQLGGERDFTIGTGRATLDIESAMGAVDIHTDEPLATAGSRW